MADPVHYKEYEERFTTEAEDIEQMEWLDVLRERFFLRRDQNRVLWELRLEVLSRARTLIAPIGGSEAVDSVVALAAATLEKGDFSPSTWKTIWIDVHVQICKKSGSLSSYGRLCSALNCAFWIVDEHLRVVADPYQRRDHLFGVVQAANFIAPWMGPRAIDAWRAELRPMFEAIIDAANPSPEEP